MQSVDNIIRVFPCWPKETAASFTNLRAQGGFLVSAEQAGGRVTKLEIISTVGGTLRLVSPWPAITAKGLSLTPDKRGIVEVPTERGEKVVFAPRAGA